MHTPDISASYRWLLKTWDPLLTWRVEAFVRWSTDFIQDTHFCSRHYFDLMEKKYEATVERVKGEIKNSASKITLTTDAWTRIATEVYLGVIFI